MTKEVKTEIEWVNYAKCGAIVLVVFGHVLLGLQFVYPYIVDRGAYGIVYSAIVAFHMPLFFFVSGYLYNKKIEEKKEYITYIKRKLIGLGIPYLEFNFIYTLCGTIMGDDKYNAKNLMRIWYRPISHFWFLYVLMVIFIFYPIIKKYIKVEIIVCCALIIDFLLISFFSGVLYKIAIYFPFFCIGNLVRDKKINIIGKQKLAVTVVLFVIILVLKKYISINYIGNIVNFLLAMTGIVSFSNIMNCLCCMKKRISKIAVHLGKNTMPIYLCHSLFVSMGRSLMIRMGIVNVHLLIWSGVLIGVVIPIILCDILRKMPYGEIVFYPGRVIGKKEIR